MTSSEPIRNWQEEWHDNKSYTGEEFDKYWIKKNWGDYGCPLTCLKLSVLKTGKFKGAICDNPDYELQAYLGTNLGIFTPEENIYLSYIIEELGLCAIQGGAVLGLSGNVLGLNLTEEAKFGFSILAGDGSGTFPVGKQVSPVEIPYAGILTDWILLADSATTTPCSL